MWLTSVRLELAASLLALDAVNGPTEIPGTQVLSLTQELSFRYSFHEKIGVAGTFLWMKI